MKDLVSVLIPAYNHQNYVQETIKSIINQTYKNIELIVIDDGSKDSTWQKIQELKEVCENRFSRVHFETKENEGTCKTLNKLLDLAKGEYIYIIASDDLAKSSAIEKEVSFLEKNSDYALVVGDNEIIDSNGGVCFWDKEKNLVYDKKSAKYLTNADFLQKNRNLNFQDKSFGTYKTLYVGNYIPNGYLIRKSIFDIIGKFTPEAPLEDYYLMLQISKYSKMKYLNEVLFSYRFHGENTVKNVEKMIKITDKTKEYEENLLLNLDKKKILPDALEFIKNGFVVKRKGIPFIFERLTCLKQNKKIIVYKLFNFEILRHEK